MFNCVTAQAKIVMQRDHAPEMQRLYLPLGGAMGCREGQDHVKQFPVSRRRVPSEEDTTLNVLLVLY